MQKESKTCVKASLLKGIYARIKGNKKAEYAVYGAIVLLVVLVYTASARIDFSAVKEETAASQSTSADAAGTETRLREVLSKIRGAGRVEVMITYETGSELVTAVSTNVDSDMSETTGDGKVSQTQKTTESSQPATVSGSAGNEPIILLERQPVVRGVIVVAEGAADINVKLDLQRAVKAVLDIPLSSIEVFEAAADEWE